MAVLPDNRPDGIVLLAIDVDGTLVTDADQVLPATREAVQRARRQGLSVVLATGRRYRTTQRVMDQLGTRLPVVCLGGALTKSADGETLDSEPFAASQIELLLGLARRRGVTLILQRDSHRLGGPDFVVDAGVRWNPETRYYVDMGGDGVHADPTPEQTGYHDILVVGAFGGERRLAALEEDFATCADGFATVLVRSQRTPGWYLETILGHVSKWSALKRVADGLGIDEASICAVGDAANDLPMIRGAGFGVAMGNAAEVVKAAADWVTGSNEEGGVASLVELLVDGRANQGAVR